MSAAVRPVVSVPGTNHPKAAIMLSSYRGSMALTRVTVASVIDEGDQVIVRGIPAGGDDEVAVVFTAKGGSADPGLAERVSRLATGDVVDIDAVIVVGGWYTGRSISRV